MALPQFHIEIGPRKGGVASLFHIVDMGLVLGPLVDVSETSVELLTLAALDIMAWEEPALGRVGVIFLVAIDSKDHKFLVLDKALRQVADLVFDSLTGLAQVKLPSSATKSLV